MFLNAKQLGATNQFARTLETTTIRQFDGGLNVIDADLNMKPKYATVLDNLERGMDGTLSIRPGTVYLSQVPTTAPIINCYYFNNYIVSVTTDGHVFKTLGNGVTTELFVLGARPWDSAIGTITYVSFAIFNSDLIICCGVRKPLIIAGKPTNPNYNILQYLVDAGSGTNVNTPQGTYVVAHGQYLVVAGLPSLPSTVYITARGTSGTFVGDPDPNDAVALDLGLRVSLGSSTITGMVSYRDKLLITFERGVLPINLGVYTGTPSVHTPSDDGFIEEFGSLAHRSMISVGDDTYYCDNIGVNSIQRVTLNATLRPTRASEFVDPLITSLLGALTQAQISQYVFSVYDMRHRRYMLFIPSFDSGGLLQETVAFSYTSVPTLKIQAWARLRGWSFVSGCRTSLQNIIFTNQNKIYSYDFDSAYNADYVGDTSVNPTGAGVPISFTWEMPWADFGKRMNKKKMRYVSMDTTGTALFTIKMYADNVRLNSAGADAPALTMQMQGGSAGGYGAERYGLDPYGGGRPGGDERLLAWNADFKIMKLTFTGTTSEHLRFISITVAYEKSDIRR